MFVVLCVALRVVISNVDIFGDCIRSVVASRVVIQVVLDSNRYLYAPVFSNVFCISRVNQIINVDPLSNRLGDGHSVSYIYPLCNRLGDGYFVSYADSYWNGLVVWDSDPNIDPLCNRLGDGYFVSYADSYWNGLVVWDSDANIDPLCNGLGNGYSLSYIYPH